MKTLIVIVNYNGSKLLAKNLANIVRTEGVDYDVCVVDNNSTDKSVEYIKKNHPNIKVLESSRNLGYGSAHNLAFQRYPQYNYYAFLNNDIRVSPDWLSEILKVFATKQNVGAVGPKILYAKKEDGKEIINSLGMDVTKHHLAYDRHEGQQDSDEYNKAEKVDGLCGAVVVMPKKIVEEVGGFNEKIFLYYEDVDLSLRIRDLGYDIYYIGTSVVYHDHMASTKNLGSFKRNWMNMCNRFVSIKGRLGFLMAIKETIWYLYSWIVWKILKSGRMTLKEYFEKND